MIKTISEMILRSLFVDLDTYLKGQEILQAPFSTYTRSDMLLYLKQEAQELEASDCPLVDDYHVTIAYLKQLTDTEYALFKKEMFSHQKISQMDEPS